MTSNNTETGGGEERKADRLAGLEERHGVYILRGRRALLTRLLADGTATADDVRAAVDLPPGIDARLLGAVPSSLAVAGIIGLDRYVKTKRPERHASIIARWRLLDADAARQWLADHPDVPAPLPEAGGGAGLLFDAETLKQTRPAAVTVGR